MDCEQKIAEKCNIEFANKLEYDARKLFQSMCSRIGYSQNSMHCRWTAEQLQIASYIIVGLVFILFIIFTIIGLYKYNHRSSNNADL